MEDPPSISEGCGGRVTDYRINVSWRGWKFFFLSFHQRVREMYWWEAVLFINRILVSSWRLTDFRHALGIKRKPNHLLRKVTVISNWFSFWVTWPLTQSLAAKLHSFDSRALRSIKGVRWFDHVSNEVGALQHNRLTQYPAPWSPAPCSLARPHPPPSSKPPY